MSDLLANTQRFIGDEPVRYAFTGETGLHPTMWWLTNWLVFLNKPRIIVVTASRILVLEAGHLKWTRDEPRALVAELPRQTWLGPLAGPWSKLALGTERIWVGRPLYELLEQANAEAGFAPPPAPPGP